MAYPTAAGVQSYSGVFIPEIWEGTYLVKYYEGSTLMAVANTKYEGKLKNQGDKIIIPTIPTVSNRPYKIGQDLEVDRPYSPPTEMIIDRGRYFNVLQDDVDKVQSNVQLLEEWAKDASHNMKTDIESEVFGEIYVDVAPENQGAQAGAKSESYNLGVDGTPFQLTRTNVLDFIIDMNSVLEENNVPGEGHFLVMPTWMANLIKKSDLKDSSLTGDSTSSLRNGLIGSIDGIELYTSNLLPQAIGGVAGQWGIYAGHKDGLSFVTQLTKTQSMDSERTFGKLMRGLQVYGFKLIKPEAWSFGVVTKG